jgi:hypothetical protein
MSFTGYASVRGGGGDDDAYFGASVDVDGAVGAALRALDDGPSLGASAGDGSSAAGASGRGAASYNGRQPGPQAPRRRPLGPNAVVTPPPSLPDSVFLLPGPSERRRQAQAEAAAAAAEAAAAAAAAPRRGGRLALLTEDSAAEAAAARESSDEDDTAAPPSAFHAAPSPAARREDALEEARRTAAAAEYAHRASYGTEEAPQHAGWSPDDAHPSRAASVASPAPSVPTRSPPASVSSAETSADVAFARGYRAALAAAQEQAAAVQPSPPPVADVPIPLPRRSPAASPVPPLQPPSPVAHRAAQRGEEGYAESVLSCDEGVDDPFEARVRAAVAPPAGLLGRVRAPGSTMGTAASSSADWSEDSWMRPARSDEILTARTAHERWDAPAQPLPLPRNVAASFTGSDVSRSWAGGSVAAESLRSVPQAPPVYVAEDARDKFAAVAASVARAQAEAAVHKPRGGAAPDPRMRRPEPAPPPPFAPANAPPRRAASPGGLQADPGPPVKREAYRATDEDHRVPVPDLVGDFTIVPGALLEAGTRLVSAVRAEIDKDVAAKRHRAAQTLENIVLGLSPGRSFDDEDGASLLPWQKALLQVGASVEQELERRQARASAAFRAMEQEQLRISLLMQNTAGAAAMGGKTVLQRWLEGAFGSKAEYDAYIAGIAATLCMAPGAKTSFVNVLRSLEPMRKEAVAKRQSRLASAHYATRLLTASGPDGALAVLGLPADAPPPLAPGTPSPLSPSPTPSAASSVQPPSRAGGVGTTPQYAQSVAASSDAAQVSALQAQIRQQYMTSARQNPPPPSSVMPGPWEPPVLDVRRPGSPQESVVLERLPGMTDEDLERLADFMGSDAGSIWGDGTDPEELTEAEAAERVARMVTEARAAAAMRAAAKRANSAQRDDFADEDAEVAAVRGNRPASGGGYSDIAASTPDGAAMRQQQQPAYAASQSRSGGAASPAPSYNGQRLPVREPSPLPPSADFGYNAFSYDAPSENTRAAWEAQLARRGGTAPPSAAGESVYGTRRNPQQPPSSVASGHPGAATFYRNTAAGDMADEDDFSYQAPPGRSVHGSFAGSTAPSMPMMRNATRQPSTGPSSAATSVAAPEDFGRVPPAQSLWARATAPAQPPMPPPRRGVQPLPAGPGPAAGAVSAARASAVASLAPKPKAPVSESDWGFDRNAILDRKRPEADRSLAASMAAAGIGGGGGGAAGPDAPSPTGWVRDRGTGAWSPAQSRPGSRADLDTPAAASPAGAQRRAPKAAAAQPLKVNTTSAAPVAVVDERWQRLIADALRVAVLLVLGAVLAFVLVLTFF